jgi:hypothetical protein
MDELMTATPRLSIVQREEGRIVLGGGVKVTQTFALDDAKRRVISSTLEDSRMGKVPPNKRFYDPGENR